MTIICEAHGEVEEHNLGDKHYCPECIAEKIFDNRINNYELEE